MCGSEDVKQHTRPGVDNTSIDEKYEVPAFWERYSATLRCLTTVCPPCQDDSCAHVCTNWQFGRSFWCFIQRTAERTQAHPQLVGRQLYRLTWTWQTSKPPRSLSTRDLEQYQRTISGIGRTNNHAEAAHRRVKRELDVVHPSIWKCIDGLHRVQKGRDVTYEQYVCGEPGLVKRREYILVDLRLLTTVNDYSNRDIVECLRGIRTHLPHGTNSKLAGVQSFSTIWRKFFQEVEESWLRLILKCNYKFGVFVFNCKMSIMIEFACWWQWKSHVDAG